MNTRCRDSLVQFPVMKTGTFVMISLAAVAAYAAVSHVPEFLLLTTEAKWYRNNRMTGKGVPELGAAAVAGDDFVVDYVRVYDIVKEK